MKGVLIYSEKEAVRNAFAIKKFKKNLNIDLVNPDFRGNTDFVVNRTNDYKIGKYFEKKGIRVFNSSKLSRLANDKQYCYEFMAQNGIPIMPIDYTKTPVVKKPVDGHGGQGVVLLDKAEPFEKNYVYQMPCDTLGKDLRVWAIGGEIIAAILRESETDFRSNFCLGGSATIYHLSDTEKTLVKKVISLTNSDYIGIDFLFHSEQLVFNEIEDTVGARMIYEKTDIDIIRLYCDYIKKELEN